MFYKLVEEGEWCPKNTCQVGSLRCDRCARNFGAKTKIKYRNDYKGIEYEKYFVKCCSWMPIWLAEALKGCLK